MTLSQIDPGVPRVPARQVVLSAVAMWLCYFLLITLRGLVVELGDFTDLLWRRALVTVAGIVVTVACWPLLRRFDAKPLATRVAAALVIMLPAALALAAVNQWAFAPVEQRMIERISEEQAEEPVDGEPSDGETTTAPTTTTTTTTKRVTVRGSDGKAGVQIRHDMAGNVLVDVLDEGLVPPKLVVPPAPPKPPAEPAPAAKAAPAAKPASRADPFLSDEDLEELEALGELGALQGLKDAEVVTGVDGTMVITRPGMVVRRFADGSSEVRAGGFLIRNNADDEVESIQRLPDDAPPVTAPPAPSTSPVTPAMRAKIREEARVAAANALREAEGARKAALAKAREIRQQNLRAREAADAQQVQRAEPVDDPAAMPEPLPSDVVTEEIHGPSDHVTIIRQTMESEGLWRQLTDVALGRYFLLIAWAALYLALGNGEQLRAAEYREGEYARAAKAAELRSLRYQVNPHFLFNTLNSLSALVMVGRSEQAERMIQSISRFYRHSLAGDPTSDVPLEDEIALQRHYLDIEAVRFPERLKCEFDVPADLMSACVPGMILQPLVENSIKYAVSTTIRAVTIRIAAREAGGFLVLTVADDGPGEGFVGGGTGIGLANVRSRLAARFGEDGAKVETGPLPAGGYATVLTLPVVRKEC